MLNWSIMEPANHEKNPPTILSFSQVGKEHKSDGLGCEDAYVTINKDSFLFCGLADGQSGKHYCKAGGKAVLTAIAQYVENTGIHALVKREYLDEIQYELIRVIRETLHTLSISSHSEVSEFSSTIVAVAIDRVTSEYLTIHLGDGCILAVKNETDVVILSDPENGITRQYTWLTTSPDAMHHLRVRRGSVDILKRIILLTDGATMFFRGGYITKKAEAVLRDLKNPVAIQDEIENGNPLDDASCIVVNLLNPEIS